MSDPGAEPPGWRQQVARAWHEAARFKGRSRRTELANYAVFQIVLTAALTFIAGFFFDRLQLDGFTLGCSLVLVVPLPALLVRRAHDCGFGGWWTVPVVLLILYQSALSILAIARGAAARLSAENILWPLDWLAILAGLGAVALVLVPGTAGSNCFGPDPRSTN